MSAMFPHVHTLNGQLWKKQKVPTPFRIRKRDACKIKWIHGHTFERECARQYLDKGDADEDGVPPVDLDAQKVRLCKPSDLATPRLTPRHPSPDFVSLGECSEGNVHCVSSLLKTNQIVFYVVQPPWHSKSASVHQISKYNGDTGYQIAEKFQNSWQRKLHTNDSIFAAWIVCRVGQKRSKKDKSLHDTTKKIIHAALKKRYGNEIIWAQRGAHISRRAKKLLIGKPNPFKLNILQIIKPDIASAVDERSVSLAICHLVT